MKPSEYLRMSEQGIGAVMTRACGAHPAVCMTGDDDEAYTGNSTQGGEVEWLYYLQKYVSSSVAMPWSVCPYIPTPTADAQCADEKTLASSPISFKVERMTSYHDLEDIKRALLASQRVLALSLPLFVQRYRLPCTTKNAAMMQCDPHGAECKPCPLAPDFSGISCCIEQDRFGTNMRGEFSGGLPMGSPIEQAGGHAVVIVGYTDTYTSSMGYTGGLIIKNSWWDGVPLPGMSCADPTAPCAAGRGSHTIAYFMGAHSPIAEREVCPNVHSPDSWYPCVDLATCTGESTAISAHAVRKVLRLKCLDDGDRSPYIKGVCEKDERFFLKNSTRLGGGLSATCLVRADGGPDLCLPPLWWEDLALLFTPVEEEDRENDPDQCGFYILPYDVYRNVAASISPPWATDFEITWDRASFVGAPDKYKRQGKDYKMLKRDTLEQRTSVFHGPFPSLSKPL